MQQPFFSVVIPTRNRPHLLKMCLHSVLNQTESDWEVIVCDNSDAPQAEENHAIVSAAQDHRVRYIRPDKVLPMHDNWEFAISHATGTYQTMLIDKFMFCRSTLREVRNVINEAPGGQNAAGWDMVNFSSVDCEIYPEKLFGFRRWRTVDLMRKPDHPAFAAYNPQEELAFRFQMGLNHFNQTYHYVLGKICAGFVKKDLVRKVQEKAGRLFFPISCDFTSCALLLHFAQSACYLQRHLILTVDNFVGNGRACLYEQGGMLRFLKGFDPQLSFLPSLPVPGVYASVHNLCAYDYEILNRLEFSSLHVDQANLIQRVKEDLINFPFSSTDEQSEQWACLRKHAEAQGLNHLLEDKKTDIDYAHPISAKESLLRRGQRFIASDKTVIDRLQIVYKFLRHDLVARVAPVRYHRTLDGLLK